MPTASLALRITQLSESLKATNALISRLATLTFQPGSEPLEGDGGVRSEFARDIHDSLNQIDEDFELLKQDVDDFGGHWHQARRVDDEKDRERARIEAQVARLTEDLRHARSAFRRAQLRAKKASDAAKQQEREIIYREVQKRAVIEEDRGPSQNDSETVSPNDLFAGRRVLAQKSKLSKEELEIDASSNVTAALRRTHDLLSNELSRSRFAQETFEQSTAALAELGEHYGKLDDILSNSRSLLSTLVQSQKSDTWYLETAFYILLATLTWLVFRRLLFGPFVKLPLFLWRITVLILNWVVWKPLYLFLTATGVIITDPYKSGIAPSKSRRPLIVQPSASGTVVKMPDGSIRPMAVPAGAGGQHAKEGLKGEVSEKFGQMAEASAKGDEVQHDGTTEGEEIRRGDGTVLKPRDEADGPPNPKRRVFEADVEDAKHAQRQARNEL